MIYYCVNTEEYAKKIRCQYPHKICYLEDFPELANSTESNFTKQIYIKLLLPYYVNEPFWVVDVDTQILKPLPKVLTAGISLALDINPYYSTYCEHRKKCKNCGPFFYNSGVIHFNPLEFRKYFDKETIIEKTLNKYYPYPEQCIINEDLKGLISPLPQNFNQYAINGLPKNNTFIYHYVFCKPWDENNERSSYYKNIKCIPGERFKP